MSLTLDSLPFDFPRNNHGFMLMWLPISYLLIRSSLKPKAQNIPFHVSYGFSPVPWATNSPIVGEYLWHFSYLQSTQHLTNLENHFLGHFFFLYHQHKQYNQLWSLLSAISFCGWFSNFLTILLHTILPIILWKGMTNFEELSTLDSLKLGHNLRNLDKYGPKTILKILLTFVAIVPFIKRAPI